MPLILLTTAQTKEKLGDISDMTLWRRRQAVPPKPVFPEPVCINGRNYFWDHELNDWVEAQAETDTPVCNIPNAEEGRVKGLEILSAINAAKKSHPEPIDQLGHNGGPPLDDAVEQDNPSVIKVGRKRRGGKNG